ncbi:MAG: cell division protein FtsA [Kiritimatiellaeota bacterium]|nr:cell division protein FtsA [Kiritimatiellota bacterium]
MAMPPIAALEIGTSRTLVCVGEVGQGDRMRILGYGQSETRGVRKGQIIDVGQARVGVETALKQAESMSGVDVWQVLLAVTGGHIQSKSNPGIITIRDGVVRAEEKEEVKEIASDIPLDRDRQALHTLKQSYTLDDDRPGIAEPEGIRCNMMTLNMLAIHGLKNRIDSALDVAKSVKVEVTDVAFAGLCASLSTLSEEQKQRGVVVLDLGGGTTSYIAFANGIPVTAGCLAVGGDHITNDIALAFNLTLTRAEEMKRKEGCAVVEADAANQRITLVQESTERDERQISRRMLSTVINARVDETFRVLRKMLTSERVLPNLGAGVVLTGGGAYLRKIKDQAQHVFGLPCEIGLPVNVDGLEADQPAAFATATGLLMYGQMSYEDTSLFAPLRKFFKRMSK